MRKILALVIIMLSTSCSKKMPPHIIAGEKTQSRFISDICHKYNMQCYAAGGGMRYDIKVVQSSFASKKPHSLEKARELYVKVTSELIDTFNTDPSVQPYLHNTPFNATNATVCFTFENFDGTPTPGINHVVSGNDIDRVRYFTRDPTTDDWIKVREETYEEAKAILQKGNI